jgi:hypothetical protein
MSITIFETVPHNEILVTAIVKYKIQVYNLSNKHHTHVSLFSISEGEVKPGNVISQWIFNFQKLQSVNYTLDILSSLKHIIHDSTICIACLSITGVLIQYGKNNTPQQVREFLRTICVDFLIQHEEVCVGVIDINLVIDFIQ